ncbi:MAG: Hpt domain-containing protein [Phycisphaerales bacterium]|nr:Hpt domain-containing protein [Phycisphaerales bacterium]
MMSRTKADEPLRSEFAGDAEMHELIEFYLEELTRKVATIESCLKLDDAGGIQMVAHQLKGSSVGYGYPSIGEVAGELEAALRSGSKDLVQGLTDQLLGLCSRALMSGAD